MLLTWLQEVKIWFGAVIQQRIQGCGTLKIDERVLTMPIKKLLAAAVALAAVSTAMPASAAIYTYTMTNNSVLSIDSTAQSATFAGADINASMTSAAFAAFPGGALPNFTAVLSSLDGTRLINGQQVTDNPLYATTTHPQKLIMSGDNVNLWAWWGNPIVGGDYLTKIKSYTFNSTTGGTSVPEPGMLGLLGAGLAGLALARRNRRRAPKAA